MVAITLKTELSATEKTSLDALIDIFDNYTFTVDKLVNQTGSTLLSDSDYAANNTDYYDALFDFLSQSEGIRQLMYEDSAGLNSIGVGFNMAQWGTDPLDLETYLKPILESIDVTDWENVYNGTEAITTTQAKELFHITMTGRDAAGDVVISNWGDVIAVKLQNRLELSIASTEEIDGQELASLFSLAFNNPSLIGSNLRNAVEDDEVNNAVTEILEHSNKLYDDGDVAIAGTHGIANRRLVEAAVYKGDTDLTLPEAEFWQVVHAAQDRVAAGLSPNSPASLDPDTQLVVNVQGALPTTSSPPQEVIDSSTATKIVSMADATNFIEIATGDDEILYASAGESYLYGAAGNDTLFGSSGTGNLDGGDGADWLDYSDSSQGVDVDVYAGNTIFMGESEIKDVFAGIEHVVGSDYADNILGNDQNNYLQGLDGADSLDGDAGADTLSGGSGNDTLEGGDGADYLRGGDGADSIVGGSGADTLVGGNGNDTLIGGAGEDVYLLFSGNGDETIIDSDDDGGLKNPDGKEMGGGASYNPNDGTWTFQDKVIKQDGTDLVITKLGANAGSVTISGAIADPEHPDASPVFGLELAPITSGPPDAGLNGIINSIHALYLRTLVAVAESFIDPLVVDLDGDGLELISLANSSVYFDFNNDSVGELSGWVGPDDGLLALDANNNGTIDGIEELFGNTTISGFDELAGYDDMANGWITSSDSIFGALRIWQDANSDGQTQSGELFTLAQKNIQSISINPSYVNYLLEGNIVAAHAPFYTTGNVQQEVGEVYFAVDFPNPDTLDPEDGLNYGTDAALLSLPLSRGYGQLESLQVAMDGNATLEGLVEALADFSLTEQTLVQFKDDVEDMLIEWAGLSSYSTSRGPNFDAKKLAFMEALFDTPFVGSDARTDPLPSDVGRLDQIWGMISNLFTDRMMIQGPLASLFPYAGYSFMEDRLYLNDTAEAILGRFDASANAGSFTMLMRIKSLMDPFQEDISANEPAYNQLFSDRFSQMADAEIDVSWLSDGRLIWQGDGSGEYHLTDPIKGSLLLAGEGDDTVSEASGDHAVNIFVGGDDDDVMTGYAGADSFFGGAGNDTVTHYGVGDSPVAYGGAGNDNINLPFADHSLISGGDGNDTVVAHGTHETVLGGLGNDHITVRHSSSTGDEEYVLAGEGSDSIYMQGDIYDSTVEGGNGDDLVILSDYSSLRQFENGYIDLGNGNDQLGESGSTLSRLDASNIILAGDGSDSVYAESGATENSLSGGAGDDVLTLMQIAEPLYNLDNQTVIYGDDGNDSITGGMDYSSGWLQTYDPSYITYEDKSLWMRLYDGLGDDTMTAANAVYVITAESGATETLDYVYGTSRTTIDLSAFTGITTFTDLVMQQVSSDVEITLPNTQVLILRGATIAELHPHRFLGGAAGGLFEGTSISNTIDGSDPGQGGSGADTILGYAGEDRLYAYGGNDLVVGGDDADTIEGGDGNDSLFGGEDDDVINGGSGNDEIEGNTGDDTIDGGDGNDLVSYYGSASAVTLNLSTGTHTGGDAAGDVLSNLERFSLSTFGDQFVGDAAGSIVFGLAGADTLQGGDGNDDLSGDDGADSLMGDDGNDTLRGGAGADTIDGGAGSDWLSYFNSTAAIHLDMVTPGNGSGDGAGDVVSNMEHIQGSAYADTIQGDAGNSNFYGGAGADSIHGGAGNDVFYADAGADTLDGGDDADWVYFTDSAAVSVNLLTGTHSGADAAGDVYLNIELFSLSQNADSFVGNSDVVNIYGLGGNDTIVGGNVATLIIGGDGADSIVAGSQNDTIGGDAGADTIDGGSGSDEMDYSASTSGVTVNLLTNVNSGGYAAGDVLTSIERILASSYADFLTGDSNANGIYAGSGADTIVGGVGADNLFGDGGADRFVYQSVSDSSNTVYDTIGDFSQTDGDKIDLTAFGSGITFHSGSYTGTAKEVAFFNPPGSLSYIGYDEDGDMNTDFEIAFDGVITFTSSDFLIA